MKPLKIVQNAGVLYIFICKCASRYSGVQFFHIVTSKSGPSPSIFLHFDFEMCFSLQRRAIFPYELQKVVRTCSVLYILTLKMCFSLQRRAIFPHRNFKKWSEPDMFCTFWLENVLLATAACNFSTSPLQKVLGDRQFFTILTSKCASRYSGVQFFMPPLNSHLRTRCFTEVTFRPSPPTNHWKTQHLATSLTFRACGFSFYWFLRNCIFFLLTLLLCSAVSSSDSAALLCLLLQLSILSEVRLINFLRLLQIMLGLLQDLAHELGTSNLIFGKKKHNISKAF